LKNEADCLDHQHRRPRGATKHHRRGRSAYRASGLVHRCTADRRPAKLDYGFRLGPVTRLFDLPAPEQSLRVQGGGQQYANEIDGRGTRARP